MPSVLEFGDHRVNGNQRESLNRKVQIINGSTFDMLTKMKAEKKAL